MRPNRGSVRSYLRFPTPLSPVEFLTASSEMIGTNDEREPLFKNHSKGDESHHVVSRIPLLRPTTSATQCPRPLSLLSVPLDSPIVALLMVHRTS